MDLNVNVKFDATPALVNVATMISSAVLGASTAKAAPGQVEPASIGNVPVPEVQQASIPAIQKADDPGKEVSPQEQVPQAKLMDYPTFANSVRPITEKLSAEPIKQLMQDMGYQGKLTAIPENRRAEFLARATELLNNKEA